MRAGFVGLILLVACSVVCAGQFASPPSDLRSGKSTGERGTADSLQSGGGRSTGGSFALTGALAPLANVQAESGAFALTGGLMRRRIGDVPATLLQDGFEARQAR